MLAQIEGQHAREEVAGEAVEAIHQAEGPDARASPPSSTRETKKRLLRSREGGRPR